MIRIACLAITVFLASGAAAQERPNILLIVADDLGYTDLGAFGGEIATPNLDELAYEGVRLTNLHAAYGCQVSRVMMMASASYAAALEILPALPSAERGNRLSREWATLPEVLSDTGYVNYMAGKWDLGLTDGYTPATRGFDRSFAMLGSAASHFAEYFWTDSVLYEEDGMALNLEDLPPDFYSTEVYTGRIIQYLQDHDTEAPWFAYLSYTAPHWPLQVPDDWLDRYADRYDQGYDVLREQRATRAYELGVLPDQVDLETFEALAPSWDSLTSEEQQAYSRAQEIYAAMVEYMDAGVGRVVDYLESSGQLDDTIIMFLSDNGPSMDGVALSGPAWGLDDMLAGSDNSLENFGRAGSWIDHGIGFAEAEAAPFKHFKYTLSEGGLRVPGFVRYPPDISAGGTADEFTSVLDVLPTILDAVGAQHPGPGEFAGRQVRGARGQSLWSYLQGDELNALLRDKAVGWSQRSSGALIRAGYKVINQPSPQHFRAENTPWRLYDLQQDPGEHRDISGQQPVLTDELVREWEQNWQ